MNDIDIVLLGDIATWVSAIGTVGAFAIGFKQIHTERTERKKRVKHEDEMKKRSHAEQLSAWVEAGELVFSNNSHHPMHEVIVQLSDGKELGQKVVVPGRSNMKVAGEKTDMHVAAVTFTDTHGKRWVKRHGEPLAEIMHPS